MLLLSNVDTPPYQHLVSLKPVKQVKPVMSSNTSLARPKDPLLKEEGSGLPHAVQLSPSPTFLGKPHFGRQVLEQTTMCLYSSMIIVCVNYC